MAVALGAGAKAPPLPDALHQASSQQARTDAESVIRRGGGRPLSKRHQERRYSATAVNSQPVHLLSSKPFLGSRCYVSTMVSESPSLNVSSFITTWEFWLMRIAKQLAEKPRTGVRSP